jgi:serine protease Do
LRRVTVRIASGRGGEGAGVVWREDGLIVTNAHVARERARVAVGEARFDAPVVAWDERLDLAALVVPARGLPVADRRASGTVRVGELVLGVGHPLGVAGALSVGIVHSTSREAIRSDLRLAPGNSGGPLADAAGRVIGVNAMIADGLGLAVASDAIEAFVARVAEAR